MAELAGTIQVVDQGGKLLTTVCIHDFIISITARLPTVYATSFE